MQGLWNWVRTIRIDRFESELTVQRDGVVHFAHEGIEAHPPVADGPRLGNDGLRQSPAQTGCPERRAHVQPLHLTHVALQSMQPGATSVCLIPSRKQQSSFRWRIHSRQLRQFLVEVLEAKAEAERLGVFQEQVADRRERGGTRSPGSLELASSHG